MSQSPDPHNLLRFMLIGDVVGSPGRGIIARTLPRLRSELSLDLVVANAENAAGGSGITGVIFNELIRCGLDGVTLGDHAYRCREIFPTLERESQIVRPGNYPLDAPGKGAMLLETARGHKVGVFSLLGRVFMQPVDCPFAAADRILASFPDDTDAVLLDFHAEATSDKQLMGRHLDGRVAAVLGTHTHVPTADETILPGGTAFQCDVGMTGPFESILGRRIDRVMETVRTFRPTKYDVADGDVRLNGTIVEYDLAARRAVEIRRVVVRGDGEITLSPQHF